MIKAKLVGEFQAGPLVIKLKKGAEKVAKSAAEWAIDWLRKNIRNKSLSLAAARGTHANRKAGDTPLIDTEAYVKGFAVRRIKGGYSAGPAPRHTARAIWLEYGTRAFPARPHWRPAGDAVRAQMSELLKILQAELKSK